MILLSVLFVVWRCTQKRFSDLDDNGDEIKWPELQPDGQNVLTSDLTINPMGTRRTGGAGMEMGERKSGEESDWDGDRNGEWDEDGEISGQGGKYYRGETTGAYCESFLHLLVDRSGKEISPDIALLIRRPLLRPLSCPATSTSKPLPPDTSFSAI